MTRSRLRPETIVTLTGLGLAVAGLRAAMAGRLELAIICLMYAGLADLFDGLIARRFSRTARECRLGLELDSLADAVSFGALPVVLTFQAGLNRPLDLALAMFYSTAAVLRLARFNALADEAPGKITHYTGLPVTYSALIFPMAFMLRPYAPPLFFRWELRAVQALVAWLFLARIKIPKPGRVFYFLFPLLAAGLTAYWLILLLR